MQSVRSLLIFGNDENTMRQQKQLLEKDSAGIAERDIAIQVVKPGDVQYKQYQVADNINFTVLLVGKDGGEKYRSAEPISTATVFGLIDAMPMRKAEMKQRHKNK